MVISTCCLLHSLFPKLGVKGMNGIVIIKIITISFICVTGWVVLGGGTRIEDPRASFRNSFAGTRNSGYYWANAIFDVINSYAG